LVVLLERTELHRTFRDAECGSAGGQGFGLSGIEEKTLTRPFFLHLQRLTLKAKY